MVSGVLFEWTSLVPIWKTIWSGLSLKTGFSWSVIHLTVAQWEGRTNTLDFSVLHEMSYPLTCLTILSLTIYTCFVHHCFRTFSLFISFLLTSYWIVLELLRLLVLYWRFLVILLWFSFLLQAYKSTKDLFAADIMYRKSCMEGYLLKSKRNVETIVIFQKEENNIDKEHLQFKDARSSLDMETRSYALFDIWNILNQRPQIKNTGK